MKKLLVAAAAAALALTSCSTSFSANDTLDAPDLKAVATENGVIVVSWESVKDANGYDLQVKAPGTEEFVNTASASNSNGRYYVSYNYYQNDKDYEFKLVTTTNKVNVVASETTVSVTTPVKEDMKDTAAPAADKIGLTLKANTANVYKITFPVDAGFNYSYKVINVKSDDAKAAYYAENNKTDGNDAYTEWYVDDNTPTEYKKTNTVADALQVAWENGRSVKVKKVDGASFVTEKAENEEGEEYIVAPYINEVTVPSNSSSYYVVIRAEPKNPELATTKYVVSAASAKYNWEKVGISIPAVTVKQIASNKARISFTPAKINNGLNSYAAASRYTVYRTVTQNLDTSVVISGATTTTSELEKVGTVNAGVAVNSATAPVYYIDDTINAYDPIKNYSYKYYVAVENEGYYGWTAGDALAYAITTTAGTTDNGVTVTSSNGATAGTIKFDLSATVGSTVVVKYGEFATKEAANAAVDSELTQVAPISLFTKATNTAATTKTVYVTDGITTSETQAYANAWDNYTYTMPLATGVKKTKVVSGTTTTYTTTTVGKYYVFKAVATKAGQADSVAYVRAYVTEDERSTPVTKSLTNKDNALLD